MSLKPSESEFRWAMKLATLLSMCSLVNLFKSALPQHTLHYTVHTIRFGVYKLSNSTAHDNFYTPRSSHGRKYGGHLVKTVGEQGEVDHEAHELSACDLALRHQSTAVEHNRGCHEAR